MWTVLFHDEFRDEFGNFDDDVQIEIRALAKMLSLHGPSYGRPRVDTLKGSAFNNMKELRFENVGGTWRVAFVFDPLRQAVLLVAGNKRGVSQKRFYENLIRLADRRYRRYLEGFER